MTQHGFSANRKPVLKSLDTIENRDALIESKSKTFTTESTEENKNRTANARELTRMKEAEWPEAEFIVGNPPFLGDKKMIAELGEEYAFAIHKLYKGRAFQGTIKVGSFDITGEQAASALGVHLVIA